MGTMTIDGRKVEFTDEKNVLTVIRKAGINIPTLCYHSEVSTFGACRLCTVEDDRGRTFASCSEEPRDGMVIYTNSGKIKKYRKLIVELLLAAHCRDCTTCDKNGVCTLQKLSRQLGIMDVRTVIKVGDTVSDIKAGKNAGAFSVGVIVGSSELGLSQEEFEALSWQEQQEKCKKTAQRFLDAGADKVVYTLEELAEFLGA